MCWFVTCIGWVCWTSRDWYMLGCICGACFICVPSCGYSSWYLICGRLTRLWIFWSIDSMSSLLSIVSAPKKESALLLFATGEFVAAFCIWKNPFCLSFCIPVYPVGELALEFGFTASSRFVLDTCLYVQFWLRHIRCFSES